METVACDGKGSDRDRKECSIHEDESPMGGRARTEEVEPTRE